METALHDYFLPATGILCVTAFLLKSFVCLDQDESDFGHWADHIRRLFITYKRHEIEEEKKKRTRIQMKINNICGYFLYGVSGCGTLALVIYLIF
jgi:hypothetical protein